MSTNSTECHDVINAVVELLQDIDGTGSFVNDVGERVFVGFPTDVMATTRPALYLDAGEVAVTRGRILGEFTNRLTLRVVGYVDAASTATSMASTGAVTAAWTLFADVKRVLGAKANQSLPTDANPTGLVHLFEFEGEVLPGVKGPYADDLGNGTGAFVCAFSYQWQQVFA